MDQFLIEYSKHLLVVIIILLFLLIILSVKLISNNNDFSNSKRLSQRLIEGKNDIIKNNKEVIQDISGVADERYEQITKLITINAQLEKTKESIDLSKIVYFTKDGKVVRTVTVKPTIKKDIILGSRANVRRNLQGVYQGLEVLPRLLKQDETIPNI
jgi:hypothetical protein